MVDSWFKAHYSWAKSFDLLNDAEIVSLVRAIWQMEETGDKQEVDGKAALIWPMIADEIMQDRIDRENGKKGGRPRKNRGENPGNNPPLAEEKKEKEEEEDKEKEQKKETKKHKKDEPGFDSFWSVYPKKQAKAEALKAWNALAPDDDLLSQILVAIQIQRTSPSWTKEGGQFVPLPATWLRGRRWEDETQAPPKVSRFTNVDLGVEL